MTSAVPLVLPPATDARGIPPLPPAVAAEFTAPMGDFFRIAARGALLQLPTFGFYRFWLTTEIRRHLWAATRIGDDAFEYVGTGRELFVGFLMALAILTPGYVLYFLLGIVAERAQAFASVPLFLLLYLFGHFAAFRARRYRATRTVFRGVRFWMTGSGVAYLARAVVWDLLTALTLGLAYPWRAASLERYLMRHTRYGDLPGDFVGTGWTLFRRGIALWVLGVLPLAATIAVMALKWEAIVRAVRASADGSPASLASALGVILLSVTLPVVVVLYPLFRAIVLRWRLEGRRVGPVAARSALRKRAVVKLYGIWLAASVGWSLVAGAAMGIVAKGFMPDLERLQGGGADAAAILAVAMVTLIYAVAILGWGVLSRLFLDRGLWRLAAASLTLANLDALDRVSAAGTPAGSLGEGLADALEFGA